jgi:hypothetical protein
MPYIGNQPAPQNVTSAEITDGTIVNADINASAAIAASKIAGLATVATSGAYSDVTGTPTIPTDFVSAATGGTFSGDIDVGGELIVDSYNETYAAVTSASNAATVNCEAGNSFSHTLTENTTFTFSNPPASGTSYSFSIEIIQDASASGFTVTWPASVDWPAATAPTLTATASAKDIFVFTTRDGGTNWYGFTAGQALA